MTELEGKFRIIRSLGTGAGGETFEAEDVRDDRLVRRFAVGQALAINARDHEHRRLTDLSVSG